MHLNIKIDNTDQIQYDYLKTLYEEHTHYHEGDSGLDLYCPEEITVQPGETVKINFGLSYSALSNNPSINNNNEYISSFLWPRSSIVKTPLRMANSIGLIDSGYRGNIIAVVDNIKTEPFTIEKGSRLFQIVSPRADPITFEIVNVLNETSRGSGGFGSTN